MRRLSMAPAGKRSLPFWPVRCLDPARAGLHNQAMMEFGALQCVPRSPDCTACPLAGRCAALRQGRVDELPVKAGGRR
ncbi:MAG: hypothetical protein ACLR8Y_02330 [Alistipes indistinctus]